MTAYRFWTITCDICGEVWDEETVLTSREARRIAKLSGWTSRRELDSNRKVDVCPNKNRHAERMDLTEWETNLPESPLVRRPEPTWNHS